VDSGLSPHRDRKRYTNTHISFTYWWRQKKCFLY